MRLHVFMLWMLLSNFLNIECADRKAQTRLSVLTSWTLAKINENPCFTPKIQTNCYDSGSDNGSEERPSSASSTDSVTVKSPDKDLIKKDSVDAESPTKWTRQGSFHNRRCSSQRISHGSLYELCSRWPSSPAMEASVTSPTHKTDHPIITPDKDCPTKTPNGKTPTKDHPTNPKTPSPVTK